MQFSCLVIFLFGLSPSICCGVGQTSKLYRLVKLMLGLSNDNCLKKIIILFQKMSTFITACREFLEQRSKRRMENGIASYQQFQVNSPTRSLRYLLPLRSSGSLKGPIQIAMSETNSFSIGREQTCNLVLPKDMFEEEENRKHDKE